ncbi:hypothetical protein B9Z55_023533 [Caenorhabditis nigoni]|uniref:Uncharacterized protein n=1 Tax=Caenorhabditis nigoni TaxID=1611254 RepID=A0A2G5SQ58_9PELO|nr:hypothetical protein B9Z55_023533 [Caenorhabditis nigoni]
MDWVILIIKTFRSSSTKSTTSIRRPITIGNKEPEFKNVIRNSNSSSSSEGAESMEINIPDVEEEKDDLEEQPATVEQSSSFTKMIECRLCNRKIIKSNSFYHKAHAAAHLRLKT